LKDIIFIIIYAFQKNGFRFLHILNGIKKSTMKNYVVLFYLLVTSSCSYSQQESHWTKKDLGLYIENGERQGFQYFDSAGNEYGYRYVTATIYNDTLIPARIEIDLTKQYFQPCSTDSVKMNVFLLPRALTPERIQKDASMSEALKHFLDTANKATNLFGKFLQPKETCVITFGVLTSINHKDPVQFGLISKGHEYEYFYYVHDNEIKQLAAKQNPFALSLGIEFTAVKNLENADCFLVIPCGQISFPKQ